jgi:hypothetical protein
MEVVIMKVEYESRMAGRVLKIAGSVVVLSMLNACVAPTIRTVAVPASPPQQTLVYPAKGQSPDQLERDRYECHVWAVQQTGVDPSRPQAQPDERVIAPLPGSGAATGAVGGAVVGSILAGPRTAGLGLLLGGATGAIVGAAADANAQAQAQQAQSQINQNIAIDQAWSQSYRQAIGACLEARGYTVG